MVAAVPVKKMTSHLVYIGDTREVLRERAKDFTASDAPHLIMTSPPYAQGMEYEQGLKYGGLWELIEETARLCFEVSAPGTFFVVNFGETTKYERRSLKTLAPDGSCDFSMGHLYCVTMKRAGWMIHSRRVWKKCFPKIRAAAYNHTMRIPVAEFENVWAWRKPGGPPETKPENKEHMRAVWDTGEEWHEHAGRGKYKAAFPLIIPRLAVSIFTEPGDWVLDPFAGSGTTALAAGLDGRNSISIEWYKDYVPNIRAKLAQLEELGHKVLIKEEDSARELPE